MHEPARSFKELVVWQKSQELVVAIYEFAKGLPEDEKFGMISQMKRSVVSVPSNIAEGFAKISKRDKVRFYNIAQGSLSETHNHLMLSKKLGYGEPASLIEQLEEVSKLLSGYIRKISYID